MTTGLRRHQLALLDASGWAVALQDPALDAVLVRHLRAWADRRWPLVVTRQDLVDVHRLRELHRRHRPYQPHDQHDASGASAAIVLGWPAPPACGRRRIALHVPLRTVTSLDEFPAAMQALPMLPSAARPAASRTIHMLDELGSRPRVYGSYGWQLLTGLPYVHAGSDLDLWLTVDGRDHADAAVAALQSCADPSLRIDGELLFADGTAVAWREYAAWRAGRTRSLLVKRLHGVAVQTTLTWPGRCDVQDVTSPISHRGSLAASDRCGAQTA